MKTINHAIDIINTAITAKPLGSEPLRNLAASLRILQRDLDVVTDNEALKKLVKRTKSKQWTLTTPKGDINVIRPKNVDIETLMKMVYVILADDELEKVDIVLKDRPVFRTNCQGDLVPTKCCFYEYSKSIIVQTGGDEDELMKSFIKTVHFSKEINTYNIKETTSDWSLEKEVSDRYVEHVTNDINERF